jgi:hypothetical protein
MASFPKPPFVIDHADLDLTDDLHDEQTPNLVSSVTAAKSQKSINYGPTGIYFVGHASFYGENV